MLIKKKPDYETKVGEIEHYHNSKYITTQEFIKLTVENFAAGLKQVILVTEADIDDFVEKTYFNANLRNLNKSHFK